MKLLFIGSVGCIATIPADLLCQLMDNAAKADAEGLCISDEQLDKEMQTW